VVGSFRPYDIAKMYKLETLEVYLDRKILQQFEENKFKGKKRRTNKLIKNWRYDPNSFKTRLNKLYPIQMFKRPHTIDITMICRLYGEKIPQYFKLEWFPLLHQIVRKEKIFN
jgi:hypothetical protein